MHSKIPAHWWAFYNKNGYFVSYHGDIYFGCLWEFSNFPESVFIVQPSSRKGIIELQNKGAAVTLEEIKNLAWEIKDVNMIRQVYEGDGNIGNTNQEPNLTRYGDQKWKKMFVFGAGASAHSVHKDDLTAFRNAAFCPPVGNELFGKKFQTLIKKYKGVELSLSSLKSFGNDVEGFFEDEWIALLESYNPAIAARHINIVFYLREVFLAVSKESIDDFYDCSLFSTYADRIQKHLAKNSDEKIACVSFNYDTILDYYLSNFFNVPFNNMFDYVNSNVNPFILFKPHGSCNWGWKFNDSVINTTNDIPKKLFDDQTSFSELFFNHLGTPNEMVYQNSWGHETELNDHKAGKFSSNKNKIEIIHSNPENYFPSLLIPYKDKDEFVMPYYHYSLMKWFINQMEDLYLIGWKGNEAAFNSLLSKQAHQLKRIIIVNPNQKEVKDNLSKHLNLTKYEIVYFTDFETFLKAGF